MAEEPKEKVYTPETIPDQPFPQEGEEILATQPSGGTDVYRQETIKPKAIPKKRIAQELIGSALNTKSRKILAEFEFTLSGALQIGKYENGVSGDLRITPNGITARDSAGLTTFSIDGTTGSAVFKGSVQAGSVITGEVIVGDNSVIIDGEGKRIIINDGNTDRILLGYQENGF